MAPDGAFPKLGASRCSLTFKSSIGRRPWSVGRLAMAPGEALEYAGERAISDAKGWLIRFVTLINA